VSAGDEPIDEDDDGRILADLVATAIVERFPAVSIVQPDSSESYHGSLVFFTPPNPGGVPVVLHANFDWSFQLEADGRILFEDAQMTRSPAEHVEWIVDEISTIARDGQRRRWPRWGAKQAPWGLASSAAVSVQDGSVENAGP